MKSKTKDTLSSFAINYKNTGVPSRSRFFELVVEFNSLHMAINTVLKQIPNSEITTLKTVEGDKILILLLPNGSGIFVNPEQSNIDTCLDIAKHLTTNFKLYSRNLEDESRLQMARYVRALSLGRTT